MRSACRAPRTATARARIASSSKRMWIGCSATASRRPMSQEYQTLRCRRRLTSARGAAPAVCWVKASPWAASGAAWIARPAAPRWSAREALHQISSPTANPSPSHRGCRRSRRRLPHTRRRRRSCRRGCRRRPSRSKLMTPCRCRPPWAAPLGPRSPPNSPSVATRWCSARCPASCRGSDRGASIAGMGSNGCCTRLDTKITGR
mmetsp:Transcript_124631/g.399152  ORF Transcript_124631/g.399152 Transcript_124631/m.399152 type:complete len:204 (+) Transcript_124631:796-1407(+)